LVLNPEIPEETSLFFDREAFAENLQYWKNLDYQNYSFDYSYEDNKEANSWSGRVTVRNGAIEKADRLPGYNFPNEPPTKTGKAWLLPIDGIFAKMEEEADNYTDGGLRLHVNYNQGAGIDMIHLHYLKITPERKETYRIIVYDVKKLP